MKTFTITKKNQANKRTTLKSATKYMSWSDSYKYAFDQDPWPHSLQKGVPAAMEYLLDDGDEIIEVDENGKEIDRCIFRD